MEEDCCHSTTFNRIDQLEQNHVREFFNGSSAFWTQIYYRKDLFAIIHQQRLAIALRYVSELSLPNNTRALEIGCGSGFMALALAKRGFTVEVLDYSHKMIKVAQNNAMQTSLDKKIHLNIGDAHNLAFHNQSFDLIIALGVTPWLYDVKKALNEIARVLVHGGYVILNADNLFRLNWLFDPRRSPFAKSTREWLKKKLSRVGSQNNRNVFQPHAYSIQKFNAYLHEANLKNVRNTNLGFGPFLLFPHIEFPDRIGVKINQKLQEYADVGFPILRSTGAQYIVLAKKV
jgi:ubiquinone/menaquinone biosynthesis C-methylase UbiE